MSAWGSSVGEVSKVSNVINLFIYLAVYYTVVVKTRRIANGTEVAIQDSAV